MLNSCVSFVADNSALSLIDKLINEDDLFDGMAVSIDFISDSPSDMNMYKCETDEHSWIDISKIEERILLKYPNISFEVIYASTDSESYVDVVSSEGNFDLYVDSDLERIAEICQSYHLEFYEADEEDYNWSTDDELESDDY